MCLNQPHGSKEVVSCGGRYGGVPQGLVLLAPPSALPAACGKKQENRAWRGGGMADRWGSIYLDCAKINEN